MVTRASDRDDSELRRQISLYVGVGLKKRLERHAAGLKTPVTRVLERHLQTTLFGPLLAGEDPEAVLDWIAEQLPRRPWVG